MAKVDYDNPWIMPREDVVTAIILELAGEKLRDYDFLMDRRTADWPALSSRAHIQNSLRKYFNPNFFRSWDNYDKTEMFRLINDTLES